MCFFFLEKKNRVVCGYMYGKECFSHKTCMKNAMKTQTGQLFKLKLNKKSLAVSSHKITIIFNLKPKSCTAVIAIWFIYIHFKAMFALFSIWCWVFFRSLRQWQWEANVPSPVKNKITVLNAMLFAPLIFFFFKCKARIIEVIAF